MALRPGSVEKSVSGSLLKEKEGSRHEGAEARSGEEGREASSAEDEISLLPSWLVPSSCLRVSVPLCLRNFSGFISNLSSEIPSANPARRNDSFEVFSRRRLTR